MLNKRLRDILNQKNLTISQFAEMCDLPFETVKNIYYGRTADPKLSTILKMSEVLGTTVNNLAGQCTHTSEEQMLINYFQACGNHGKSVVLFTAKSEAMLTRYERELQDRHKIPCIVPTESMRDGIMYSKCNMLEIYTTSTEAYISLKIIDNDFVPLYCKDDIILLSNRFPNHGEYGVFFVNNKACVRQYLEENNHYILRAIHSFGDDIVLKRLDVEYIGTCIGVIRE